MSYEIRGVIYTQTDVCRVTHGIYPVFSCIFLYCHVFAFCAIVAVVRCDARYDQYGGHVHNSHVESVWLCGYLVYTTMIGVRCGVVGGIGNTGQYRIIQVVCHIPLNELRNW